MQYLRQVSDHHLRLLQHLQLQLKLPGEKYLGISGIWFSSLNDSMISAIQPTDNWSGDWWSTSVLLNTQFAPNQFILRKRQLSFVFIAVVNAPCHWLFYSAEIRARSFFVIAELIYVQSKSIQIRSIGFLRKYCPVAPCDHVKQHLFWIKKGDGYVLMNKVRNQRIYWKMEIIYNSCSWKLTVSKFWTPSFVFVLLLSAQYFGTPQQYVPLDIVPLVQHIQPKNTVEWRLDNGTNEIHNPRSWIILRWRSAAIDSILFRNFDF